MGQMDEFKGLFFEESNDLLTQAEESLMDLSPEDPSPDTLGAIFRAVHSIKGGAGAFGFERLVKFTHSFETVLDALRSGKIGLDKSKHELLMKGFDLVSDLVREAKGDVQLAADREAPILHGLGEWYPQLHGVGGAPKVLKPAAAPAPAPAAPAPVAAAPAAAPAAPAAPASKAKRWMIFFKPYNSLYVKANEPLLLLRQVQKMGTSKLLCTIDHVPTLDSFDPEEAYLNWTVEIETERSEKELAEVFEFVEGDCDLIIGPMDGFLDAPPEESADMPGIAVEQPAAAPVEAAPVEAAPVAAAPATEHHDEHAAAPKVPAAGKAGAEKEEKVAAVTSIRVDLDKIDKLVNMVGEIVITQAMVQQQLSELELDKPELLQGLEAMQQHTRELQDSVMSVRAQPVKSVFQRMPRLVRELASQLNKEIKLVTLGENTEVDKTVIEQLSDPLTHMIRNSVDHGIEMPEKRVANGKPSEGTITLSAEHRSGRIQIEIVDDGGGINREKVKAKCIEKGLISPDAQLTDEEIDNFIFLPGFSTADKVSNVSGRGVGMDVVKKNIQALGGRVHVVNNPGKGSRFILSLPLTLAVLDGMVVSVGAERYVLPLGSIIELLRPTPDMISKLVSHGDLIHIRGEYIRLLHLHSIFNIKNAITNPEDALIVLVEVEGGNKIGIVVDEVLGQQQVVIKSLEASYKNIEGVSAATILGDGRVALILDVIGLRQILLDSAVLKDPVKNEENAA